MGTHGSIRIVARFGMVLALALGPVAAATPASAHSVAGAGASDFHTGLDSLSPAVPGLTLKVIENGARLELHNGTASPVVVYGYEGEPYARVQPDGVFVNDHSPATYLNADRNGTTPIPADADPAAPPAWRKVSGAPVWRWHDHRTHWMAAVLPPAVVASPGEYHRISSWTVTLDSAGVRVTAAGHLDWVPGPAPDALLLLAIGLAIALAGTAGLLRRPHAVLAGATAVLIAADITHLAGVAGAVAGGFGQKLGAFTVAGPSQVLVWLIGALAVGGLARARTGATWGAAAVAAWVIVVTGVIDMPVLWRSSAPTVLPIELDRLTVVAALGLGSGLILAPPVLRWRHPANRLPGAGGVREETAQSGNSGQAEPEDPAAAQPAGPKRSQSTMGVGRREVVGLVAAGGVGTLVGAAGGVTLTPRPARSANPATVGAAQASGGADLLSDVGSRRIAFHGTSQAGIITPDRPQAHAWVAGFDLVPRADGTALRELLRRWTDASARMTGSTDARDAPAALTVTVGFGPSLFGKAGIPATARPVPLAPLPAFAGDHLDPARSNGDLGVLVCADDPMVVFQAGRALTRLAAGAARLRWQMTGFDRARGAIADGETSRNLMGNLDGTKNPHAGDPGFPASILVPDNADPAWLRGGSYLVVRRIRMLLDAWDALAPAAQDRVVGRRKDNGAPLSGGTEHTPANYGARNADSTLAIPENAHIRLAAPAFNSGATMLRRGYSFADGTAPDGSPDAGLLFLAWQADPRHGFIPVQRRLAGTDALGPFIRHESSALFAMPGGVRPGGYFGQSLLAP